MVCWLVNWLLLINIWFMVKCMLILVCCIWLKKVCMNLIMNGSMFVFWFSVFCFLKVCLILVNVFCCKLVWLCLKCLVLILLLNIMLLVSWRKLWLFVKLFRIMWFVICLVFSLKILKWIMFIIWKNSLSWLILLVCRIISRVRWNLVVWIKGVWWWKVIRKLLKFLIRFWRMSWFWLISIFCMFGCFVIGVWKSLMIISISSWFVLWRKLMKWLSVFFFLKVCLICKILVSWWLVRMLLNVCKVILSMSVIFSVCCWLKVLFCVKFCRIMLVVICLKICLNIVKKLLIGWKCSKVWLLMWYCWIICSCIWSWVGIDFVVKFWKL